MSTEDLDFGGVIKKVYDPATEALQVDIVNTGPIDVNIASTNSSQTVLYTFAVDFSSINNSSGPLYVLVPSTSAHISQIVPYDTTGIAIGLYVNNVLKVNLGPGYDLINDLSIAPGSNVSIQALGPIAPTAGTFFINFIG